MAPRKLLNKHFILLFQGQLVSQIGVSVYLVGIMFWLKQTTNSATLIGLFFMAGSIPAVLFGPIGGTIADRYSRKKIIVWSDIFNGLFMLTVAAVMGFMPEANGSIIWLLFVITFISGGISAVFRPAISAVIPDLVPQGKIEAANGLLQSSVQVSLLIGQFLGGLLFVALGAPVLVCVSGVGFLLSAFSECFITITQKKAAKVKGWGETLTAFKVETLEGFHYIRGKAGLFDLFMVMAVISFFIAPFGVLLPFFVEDKLGSTPEWYGFLMAGLAFGMLLGSALAGVVKIAPRVKGKVVIGALMFFSVCLCGVGFSGSVVVVLFILIFMGACFGLIGVLVSSVIQRSTPSEIRGRVFGLLATVSMALSPVAMGLVGVVADLVDHNIMLIYLGCGVCSLIVTSLLLFSGGFHELLSLHDEGCVDKSYNVVNP